MLSKLFRDDSPFGPPSVDADGHVFIDRDGDAFVHVLNYLRRSGNLVGVPSDVGVLARIKHEADYFGLTGLARQVKRCCLPDNVISNGAFQDLAALGLSAHTILSAGHTASKLRECGITVPELKGLGWTPTHCKVLGFTAVECKDAGFSATELQPLCKSILCGDWRDIQQGNAVIAPRSLTGDDRCFDFGRIKTISYQMDLFGEQRIGPSTVKIKFEDRRGLSTLDINFATHAGVLFCLSFMDEEDEQDEQDDDAEQAETEDESG